MITINTNSKPQAREPGGPATPRQLLLGSRLTLSSFGAVATAALVMACAGELEKDPSSFEKAFSDTAGTTGGSVGNTGGGSSTGGAANTGGSGTTGGTTGTGGSSTGGGGAIPPDDECVAMVFSSKTCSTSCHKQDYVGIPALSAGLALDGPNVGARLVTHASTGTCTQGAPIIDRSNKANSILIKKVTGMAACGDPMPPGTAGLTGPDLKCITDWVNKF